VSHRVLLFGRDIGSLHADRARLSFSYGEAALDDPSISPLSVRLPKREEPYGDPASRAFFENLLPEEEYRRLTAMSLRISESNTAGLLGAVGGECAGAVSVWPAGVDPPTHPRYRDLPDHELRAMFAVPGDPLLIEAQREGRLSLAGAQAKLTLRRSGEGWQLPLGGAPATHILKRTRVTVPHLVENEFFCMRLARAAGLPVADVEFLALGISVLVVNRFDRLQLGHDIARLHQEDFCQATGTPPQQKYEAEGGPSLAACADVLRQHSALPIADLSVLIRWVAFNYLIGNEDAHGKNLALLYTPDGLRLAPFYDLVCSTVYRGLSRNAAMGIGGERRHAYVERRHWERFADAMQLRWGPLHRLLRESADAVEAAVDDTVKDAVANLGEFALLQAIERGLRERLQKLRQVLA